MHGTGSTRGFPFLCTVRYTPRRVPPWISFCLFPRVMSVIAKPAADRPARPAHQAQGWKHEFGDVVRGACGGFLLGTPLLYTEEVWWLGAFAAPPHMLGALATMFAVVFVLTRTAGFRQTKDVRWIDSVMDSIEALAIGLSCTAFVLVLLRRITPSTSLHEALGQIVFESVAFGIGVALARQFFGGGTREETPDDRQQGESEKQKNGSRINATLAELGATLIGAMIISLNIAPTGELEELVAAVTGPWLLAVIAASLAISYALVFVAGFGDQNKRKAQRGVFQHPISETVASYLLALAAGVFMLWFWGRVEWGDPWQLWLHYVVVFGLPTAIGGAAGRLAV